MVNGAVNREICVPAVETVVRVRGLVGMRGGHSHDAPFYVVLTTDTDPQFRISSFEFRISLTLPNP